MNSPLKIQFLTSTKESRWKTFVSKKNYEIDKSFIKFMVSWIQNLKNFDVIQVDYKEVWN
jgi:hypothetical protein